MYYFISFAIYFAYLYAMLAFMRRNFKSGNAKRSIKSFKYYKPRNKTKGIPRWKRIRELPTSTKLLFHLWFISSFFLWIVVWIVSVYLQPFFQRIFILPSNIHLNFIQHGTVILFVVANFFISITVAGLYSNLLYRGKIRAANNIYKFGVFWDSSKSMNLFMSWVGFAISGPMIILSLNCYFYFTNDYFVVKNMFSLSSKQYALKEIKEVKIDIYEGKSWRFGYDIYLKNGQSLNLNSDFLNLNPEWGSNDFKRIANVEKILFENNIKIVRPELDYAQIKNIKKTCTESYADFLVEIAAK